MADPDDPVPTPTEPPDATADAPVLPTLTRDELDIGWGDEDTASRRDDDWYLRERPPHHE